MNTTRPALSPTQLAVLAAVQRCQGLSRSWLPLPLIRARLGMVMRPGVMALHLEALRRAGEIEAGPADTWRLRV